MFEKEIEQIKQEIIENKRKEWEKRKAKELMSKRHIPCDEAFKVAEQLSQEEDFLPYKGFMEVKHERGFFIIDIAEFGKLPKTQREKILKVRS